MHICYICREYAPSLRGGGIASYIKEVASGMVQRGHKVTIICASDDTREFSDTKEGNLHVIRLSAGDFVIPQIESTRGYRLFRPLYKFNAYRKKIARVVSSLEHIDIIEVAEYGAESLFLDGIMVPVVVRMHAPTFIIEKFINPNGKFGISGWMRNILGEKEKQVLLKATYINSCSDALRRRVSEELKIPLDKMDVIYNPIQTDKWDYIVHSFINKERFKIILPGAITPLKGSETAIKACERLNDEGVNVDLFLVGKESKYANELRTKYSTYKWLHIEGPIPRENLMQMYDDVDVVCIPSLFENMPMVCIESMFKGCIVVANRVGGIPEVIEDGKTGFLCDATNSEILAARIKEVLMMSKESKREVSANAHQHIVNVFSIDKILSDMEKYYCRVIEDYKKKKI